MRERPDDYPIIELGVGSYVARDKSRGRIKFPILKPIGWSAKAPLLKALEGSATAEPEESESEVIKAEQEERAAKAARRGRSGGTKLEDTF